MLVVMKPHATAEQVDAVVEKIRALGLTAHPIPGAQRVAIGITGNKGGLEPDQFTILPGVADAIRVSQPFKLVSREVKEEDTVIDVRRAWRWAAVRSPSWPAPARSSRASRSWRPRWPSSRRAPASCAAAPTSRAPARTSSRAWPRRASSSWPWPASRPGSRSSPR